MATLSVEIVEGVDAGRMVPLEGPLLIGRGAEADLQLTDPKVSRRHARVTPMGTHATVEDLESVNGTLLDGAELTAPVQWDPGEDLVVGTTVIELRTAESVAERPSAVRPVPPALAVPERPPDYVPPVAPTAAPAGVDELDRLIDTRVHSAARIAPLAVLVLVALAVIVFLAVR